MRIILNFESPILIGSKKHSNNFMETEEVIKGSVIRAAFAKQILNECVEIKNDSADECDRINWVYYRGRKGCEGCRYNSICKKFSDVSFSYFYPEKSEPVPLTSMICKTDDSHGYIDILMNKVRACNRGNCINGRVEFKSGLRHIGKDNIKVPYSSHKSVFTKNAVNPYSGMSADGKLYSVEAVSDTGDGEIVYEGSIDGLDSEELKLFKTLRVGGDTTVGFGKCTLSIGTDENKTDELEKTKAFSDRYVFKEDGKNYLAVVLTGDAIIDFDIEEDRYYTNEEYKTLWEKALNLDSCISVDKIYTEYSNYRGYDSSNKEDTREEPIRLVSKGTVIVFKSDKPVEYLYKYFSSIKGFGSEVNNGFGQFKVYYGR